MKKILFFSLLMFISFVSQVYSSFEDNLKAYAYSFAFEFVSKPDELISDIQNDIDDVSSSPFQDNRFQLYTNPVYDVMTILNMGVKAHVFDERTYVPRITLGFSYWNFFGLGLIPDFSSSSVYGFTPALTLSKSFQEDTKLFLGFKYPVNFINVSLSKVVGDVSVGGTSLGSSTLQEIKSVSKQPSVYCGMNYLTENGKEVSVLVGYTFTKYRIYAKIQRSGPFFDLGIGFYPEAIFLLHPYCSFHVKF